MRETVGDRAAALRRLAATALVAIVFCGDGQAAEDGTWTGRFKGLGQENVQVWVANNRFKLFSEWPGGRIASADGEIRADGSLRVCGSYQRSQQSDNLCIDGRFAGDRFTGRWSVGAGEDGEILLTRSGGGEAAATTVPATPASQPALAQAPPTPSAPAAMAPRRAAVVAVGDFVMPDGRANESGRQQLLSHLSRAGGPTLAVVATRPGTARADIVATARHLGGEATQTTDTGRAAARAFGYNIGSPDRLRVTARIQVDLTRVADGLLLSEIAEAGDKIDSGANAQSASAAFANKAIGEAVQRLVTRLSTDRQDFLAGLPETLPTPAAPAAVAAARSAAPPQQVADDRPVVSVGDFVMSDGARNETGRQLLIAALNRSASSMLQVSALAASTGRQNFRVTGRNLGAEATVTGTRGGRGGRVNTFRLAVQVQVEMLRLADGQVLTEQVELTDTVAGDNQAVNQQGAALLRTGIERAVALMAGRLTGDRRDFLAVPRQPPAVAAARPSAPLPGPEFDRSTRRQVQEDLKSLGLYRGGIDGELGSQSRAAIQAFQRMIGEAPTGALTDAQLNSLKRQAATRLAESGEQKRQEQEARREETPAAALQGRQEDLAAWDAIKGNRDPAVFAAFVRAFPDSRFAPIAKALSQSTPAVAAAQPATVQSKAPAHSALPAVDFGTYHALVIGIAEYRMLPKLKTAADDARAIGELLRRSYGFSTRLLIDAGRADIVDALDDLRRTLGKQDNLLIYYAGHGWHDQESNRGYWLPVDAVADSRVAWLSNADITDALKAMQAKHVLIVADSCYSGTLLRGVHAAERTSDYIQRMAAKRARLVMTSGGLEPVVDDAGGKHSPFARALLGALEENTHVLDGTSLFSKIRAPVMLAAPQTPEYADIRFAGHDGGDFLFVRARP